MGDYFESEKPTERENAINSYFRLIVLESTLFSIVKSKKYRSFIRYDLDVSVEVMQETMLKSVELVEERIRKELHESKGAIMFDEWNKRGLHYVAMLASYFKEVTVKQLDEKLV